ncbi:MAG TPA: substrate-binding domain-containing protein [Planctomycetaceae bacterium]|nr:substrate-binding domain-containing protein [Planctomycetaceae bacterium]
MRFVFALTVLAELCIGLAGCSHDSAGEKSSGGSPAGRKLRIAVIPKGTTHEFWKSVHAGAANAARELGNVEIIWKGSLLENDRDGQISVVQDFVTQKVDGICLAPLDSQALVPYVKEAREEGIPTVIFDSALDDESDIVSYVATDNYKGGVLAARRLGEVLGGKGGVILLRYNTGSESTVQREEGFLDTLKKEFPNVTILSSNEYSGTTPETSLDKSQQLFIRFRDEVDGVFAVCEPNSTGMLKALEQEGLAGKVKFIGFDPSPQLIQAMREKKLHGIVLQDPVKMGYLGVMTLVEHLQGKRVEKRISTGEYVATPENMDEPEMQRLLSPPQYGE